VKDDADFGLLHGQALAGADEKGDPAPAPVVDLQLEGDISLGARIGVDAVDLAKALVLAAHALLRVGGPDRLQQLQLLVPDRVRVVAGRRLHRGQRQHLQQVVLDDVAQGADLVVEDSAVLDPEVLGHRHLHVGDLGAVPDRLEDRVGEAQVGDVHHRFLAEEVVDAKDGFVGERRA